MLSVVLSTEDEYLFKKAELLLEGKVQLSRCGLNADITATDTTDEGSRYLLITSANGIYRLYLPARLEEIAQALSAGSTGCRLRVMRERCLCYIDGTKIRLTQAEAALLSLLYEAEGAFVSREEIMRQVFPDANEDGIVNVYIHYLREKLEHSGEKIIISSRKEGYRIAEKFAEEGKVC